MRPRRLTPSDASAYRTLMLRAYEEEPDAFTSTVRERESQPLTWWRARVSPEADAEQAIWGVVARDRLVGVAGIRFEQREKTRHKAHLFGMYVVPEHRGGGLGTRLVEAVLEHARETEGVRAVYLTVREPNRSARALYAACGFEPFGVEPLAVRSPEGFVSTVHMWRPVNAA